MRSLIASTICNYLSEPLQKLDNEELEKQIPQLPRAEIARCSIDTNGKIIDIEIYFNDSNVFKLISSKRLQRALSNKTEKLFFVAFDFY